MSVVLTEQYVRHHFTHFCQHNPAAFFSHVSPAVHWQVMGSMDISGQYHSVQQFQSKAFNRVAARLTGSMTLTLTNCIVSGQQAAVEMVVNVDSVKQVNGAEFPNAHCWVVHYDESGVIDRIRMYMDGVLLQQLLTDNPGP